MCAPRQVQMPFHGLTCHIRSLRRLNGHCLVYRRLLHVIRRPGASVFWQREQQWPRNTELLMGDRKHQTLPPLVIVYTVALVGAQRISGLAP